MLSKKTHHKSKKQRQTRKNYLQLILCTEKFLPTNLQTYKKQPTNAIDRWGKVNTGSS